MVYSWWCVDITGIYIYTSSLGKVKCYSSRWIWIPDEFHNFEYRRDDWGRWISRQEILYNTWRDYRRENHITSLDLLTYNISHFIHDTSLIYYVFNSFESLLPIPTPCFENKMKICFMASIISNLIKIYICILNTLFSHFLQKSLQPMLFLFVILYVLQTYVHRWKG